MKLTEENICFTLIMSFLIILLLFLMIVFRNPVFAGSYVTETIVGSGNWTDSLSVQKGSTVNVSIGSYNSTTAMTITLQRKLPGDSSFGRDMHEWDVIGSSDAIECVTKPETEDIVFYRLGCDTGDYTSGNCTVRLGGGRK